MTPSQRLVIPGATRSLQSCSKLQLHKWFSNCGCHAKQRSFHSTKWRGLCTLPMKSNWLHKLLMQWISDSEPLAVQDLRKRGGSVCSVLYILGSLIENHLIKQMWTLPHRRKHKMPSVHESAYDCARSSRQETAKCSQLVCRLFGPLLWLLLPEQQVWISQRASC